MKIKLLIATDDPDYAEHLSCGISERHADVADVSVCRTKESLRELLAAQKFDAALLETKLIGGIDLSAITLPLLLWEDTESSAAEFAKFQGIRKYQRISSIVSVVLEKYAKASPDGQALNSEKAKITAVWSPAGGTGKTTAALALAAKRVSEGKHVLYLDMEPFSSVPAYFPESGKSISTVFEMLENNDGNVEIFIRGVCRKDSGGINYFCPPDNFDDLNILSTDNVAALIRACAGVTDELIVDLSCSCDERTRQVFLLADRVLLLADQTRTAQTKLSQFMSQHDVFDLIKNKTVFIANKGTAAGTPPAGTAISLPLVQSSDHVQVYKTLSASMVAL